MGFNTKGLQVFHMPWFHGAPQNAKKASATLTISGIVSDQQNVVIGNNTYEFDMDNNLANGLAIQVDMTSVLTKAMTTLAFSGVAVATETFMIGTRVYEFSADGTTVTVPTNVPVDISGGVSGLSLITAIAAAVDGDEDAVVTSQNGVIDPADAIEFWAKVGGTVGNSIDTTETCTNASFTGETLAGGLQTCSSVDATNILLAAITNNDTVVTASIDITGGLVVTYNLVGTEGNDIGVSETLVNGTWGVDVTTLSGGQYATPCNASSAVIVVSNTIYFTDKPCTKWTEDAWYSAVPTLL